MTIGETIRKMRRAHDITQEDLAELLHITPQAVSRWETDATTPDVGSLMGLARIFDCTTDELLGMNAVKKEDRIKEYKELVHEASLSGEPNGEKVIAICRDALQEFPGDFELMRQLSFQLYYFSNYYEEIDPEKHQSMMNESITLLEYITAHCTDSMILADSCRQLHGHLSLMGRTEEAKKYLSYFSGIGNSREVIEFEVGEPSEYQLIFQLVYNLQFYNALRMHDRKKTPEQQVEIAHQLEGLYSAFGMKGRYWLYTPLAWAYAGIGDAEKTLLNLRIAAVTAAERDNPEDSQYQTVIRNSPKDNRDEVAEELSDSRYDFVRDTPEFAEILGIITK
ncbi:MAG: helix-turn-helix transcriptional regulator [Clostridia bacterium]|nr:helix-turn-helix transcriptional regulator [Clostridia bacterium]